MTKMIQMLLGFSDAQTGIWLSLMRISEGFWSELWSGLCAVDDGSAYWFVVVAAIFRLGKNCTNP